MENSETICLASFERFWGWKEVARGKGARGSERCHGNADL